MRIFTMWSGKVLVCVVLVWHAYVLSYRNIKQLGRQILRPFLDNVHGTDDTNNMGGGKPVNLIIDSRKNKGDNRESLPFCVVEITKKDNETKDIGTYLLDASTACGDILELGEKGVFKVKRVRFLYNFVNGKFRVFKKKIDVTSVKTMFAQNGYEASDIFQ